MTTHWRPSTPELSFWLRANAIFSAASGGVVLLASAALPGLLGAGSPPFYLVLGAGLLLFAARLWQLSGSEVPRWEAGAVVAADLFWVLGSIVVVASDLLTPVGDGVVSVVAVIVGIFAVGQWRATLLLPERP